MTAFYGIKKVGNWHRVNTMVRNLHPNMKRVSNQSLKEMAEFADKQAVGHLDFQDLPWPALSPNYAAQKLKDGYGKDILVRTGKYKNSIENWLVIGKSSHAGIREGKKDKDGKDLNVIGTVHEFGSSIKKIPARPLWGPVMEETKKQFKKKIGPKALDFIRAKR